MSWQPKTLREFLVEHARMRPDAEALVTDKVRLSYRELNDEVWRAARAMHAMGIQRGDFVGLLFPNDDKWVILFFAAALLGATTVPANTVRTANEHCAFPQVMTGGGHVIQSIGPDWSIQASAPVTKNDWRVQVADLDSFSRVFDTVAVCLAKA